VAQAIESDARVGEVLEFAAAFFSEYLQTSGVGASVLARIAREGIEGETLRAFGVGYAPGEHQLVLEHLGRSGYAEEELYAAGIATRSGRGHVHSQFRSRIMFPIRDGDGRMLGFAGMATNPGPSWPLWLTSPDRGRFRNRTAIFALERAEAAIGEAGHAVVFRDCLDVLRMHQADRGEAVAVIRCPITSAHVAQIAAALGASPAAVTLERPEGPDGVVVRPQRGTGHERNGQPPSSEIKRRVRTSDTSLRPDPIKTRSPAARAFLQIVRGGLGIAIPLTWLVILHPDPHFSGGADPAFIGSVGGVAGTYVVLAIVGAIAAARIRARSRACRMRGAWEMGLTEWQPLAWTYHTLEEILIGAAIVSIVVCTVLFLVMGGFTS